MEITFSGIPPFFRQKIIEYVLEIVKKGESLQLVALPGAGKTMLAKFLVSQFVFEYIDLNLAGENAANLVLKNPKIGKEPLVIIFDSLDLLDRPLSKNLYQTLAGIKDKYRPNLSYIFLFDREIIKMENLLPFGRLGTCLTENVTYLPLLNQKESLWYIKECEKLYLSNLDDKQIKIISEISGGFPRTLKQLTRLAGKGQLERVIINPSSEIHLNYHFEQLLESLFLEKETLKKIIAKEFISQNNDSLSALRNLFIVDDKNNFLLPLFTKFLQQKFALSFEEQIGEKIIVKAQLTANEYSALNYLEKHFGKICSREEISNSIWGEKASLEVTNHAIDQLLHRLRKKLSEAQPPVKLQTIRKRGHRLSFA